LSCLPRTKNAAPLQTFIQNSELLKESIEATAYSFNSFVNQGLSTGKFKFKDFTASVLGQLGQIALQFAALKLQSSVFGTGGGGSGGGGSGFFGNLLGGVVKSFLPGFADGGITPANQPFIVGERGPEIMMMGQSGRVIPNDVAFGGGGGMAASSGGGQQVTVYQTFNVQDTDVGSFAAQLKQQSSMIGNIALGHVQYADNKRGRSGVMDRSR
jgi:phage-related minor tail protein